MWWCRSSHCSQNLLRFGNPSSGEHLSWIFRIRDRNLWVPTTLKLPPISPYPKPQSSPAWTTTGQLISPQQPWHSVRVWHSPIYWPSTSTNLHTKEKRTRDDVNLCLYTNQPARLWKHPTALSEGLGPSLCHSVTDSNVRKPILFQFNAQQQGRPRLSHLKSRNHNRHKEKQQNPPQSALMKRRWWLISKWQS